MSDFPRCRSMLLLLAALALRAQTGVQAPPVWRNTNPSVKYTGSASCASAGCHQDLARRYASTPMGSSMTLANIPAELARAPQPVIIFNAGFDRYFKVFQDGKHLYQSEFQKDAAGKLVFETTHKLEYSVGGGMNGYTYLVRRGNHLFEAPLSYYSNTKTWDLSPGYVGADVGFSRPALAGCLTCHNGQPEAVADREALYKDPPFRFGEVAIGCEACHGPGEIHNREMAARRGLPAKPRSAAPDTSIVDPARLPPRLSDDVCMNCHQGGHTRILQPGKDYLDFRPGTPLDTISAIFQLPLQQERREEANQAQVLPPVRGSLEMPSWWKNSSMQMSRCFQASSGRLRCVSCHQIHSPPTALNRAAYYRSKCLACHTSASCRLPAAQRMARQPANDCAGCHMVKRPVGGIAHSSLTNHRIMRRPGQPLPDIAFQQPTELPGLIRLNAPAGSGPVPLLTQLAAYGEIMKRDPSLKEHYLAVLDRLATQQPDDPIVLAALGRKALFDKEYAAAAGHLYKALERGSQATTTFVDLGDALSADGRHEEAVEALKHGIAISPYAQVLYKSLALEYITLKQYLRAHETIRKYVDLFPEDSFMRGLLTKIEANQQAP